MQNKTELIVVAGGIGCGKSVVCRILATLGYAVYDCDSRAKAIMDESCEIIDGIASGICREAIVCMGGKPVIDRKRLAEEVFSDVVKLKQLNTLVHGAVKRDILMWRDGLALGGYSRSVAFVETALLRQSGLAAIADGVWEVAAPLETRVQRAMQRDQADRARIEARIRSQELTGCETGACSDVEAAGHSGDIIDNDGVHPVLPVILRLLEAAEK